MVITNPTKTEEEVLAQMEGLSKEAKDALWLDFIVFWHDQSAHEQTWYDATMEYGE